MTTGGGGGKICPACGHRNPSTYAACTECSVVFAKYRKRQEVREKGPDVTVSTATGEQMSLRGHRATKGPKLWVIGVAAAVVLGVVALLVFVDFAGAPLEVVGQQPGAGKPVLILLHGKGQPADAMLPAAKQLAEDFPELTIMVPGAKHSEGRGASWLVDGNLEEYTEAAKESVEQINDIVADLQAAGVASGDIYVGGLGQGAQFVLEMVTKHSDAPQVAGIFLVCGQTPYEVNHHSDHISKLPGDLRVFIAHGKDDGLVPPREGRYILRLFNEAGFKPTFLEFKGKHQLNEEAAQGLVQFLKSG